MVIWATGLSGAGKTTLCEILYAELKKKYPNTVILDGDYVRTAFGGDLTHSVADRVRQVKRLQGMSKVLSDQGIIVIVAVLYSSPELDDHLMELIGGFF